MLPEMARHTEKFYYFYEVANEGSLQATARKIGIAAPSLSHALKQLENVVGAQLFIRSKSGMSLTSAGKKLYTFCHKYFRELEEVQRLIDHPGEKYKRKIKIGTFQSIALYFWPLLLESLQSESNLSLSITTNRSKHIMESLVRRDVDIALSVEGLKHDKLIKHELYEDKYAFYVPSSWKTTKLKRKDLYNHAILYMPDAIDKNEKPLRQYLNSWDLVFQDEFELDSFEVICEFVKKGHGVGILPTRVAESYGQKSLTQTRIEGLKQQNFGPHRFFLSYRNDLDIPQQVVEIILESARKAVLTLS